MANLAGFYLDIGRHEVARQRVEVTLEPGRAGLSPEQVRAFFRGVTLVYEQIHESEEEK